MEYKCSFCGRDQKDVDSIVASGTGTNICSDCTKLAYEIVMAVEKGETVSNRLMKPVTMEVLPTAKNDAIYKCYFDGSSKGNPGEANCGFVVLENGKVIYKDTKPLGIATNNVAEYHGLLSLVDYLVSVKAKNVQILGDSQLVIKQTKGEWRVKSVDLKPLNQNVKTLLAMIPKWDLQWIPREQNTIADQLAQKGK